MNTSREAELWFAVDEYFSRTLASTDTALEAALRASKLAGLPPFQVSPLQGKLLQLIALTRGARRILEIGTLGGYSTLWLARALPAGGRLVTLELNPKHAAVAQLNLTRAGLAEAVEVRVGPALDSLAALERDAAGPFDLVFIDADKTNSVAYLQASLRLARTGTVIIADNVVREGAVVDERSTDPSVIGAQRLCKVVGRHPRLSATALQTVGAKGYDGFLLAVVIATESSGAGAAPATV
jgi:predicted O-methyltransferase YrrM